MSIEQARWEMDAYDFEEFVQYQEARREMDRD